MELKQTPFLSTDPYFVLTLGKQQAAYLLQSCRRERGARVDFAVPVPRWEFAAAPAICSFGRHALILAVLGAGRGTRRW